MIDSDNDGFIDAAYIGDLGSNLWRFEFCSQRRWSLLRTSSSSDPAFAGAGHRPRLDAPTRRPRRHGDVWSTRAPATRPEAHRRGHRAGPSLRREGRHAVRRRYRSSSLEHHDQHLYRLARRSTGTSPRAGEVPLRFLHLRGQVYFATYAPATGSSDPYSQRARQSSTPSPTERLRVPLEGSRSMTLGVGIPTAPVLSMNPRGERPGPLCHRRAAARGSATTPEGEHRPLTYQSDSILR